MNPKLRKWFAKISILVTLISLILLVKFGAGGGPCNGGLTILLLAPIIIVLAVIQIVILTLSGSDEAKWMWFQRVTSIICTCFWIFITIEFYDDAPNALMYLIPFLILNLSISIVIFLKYKNLSNQY